MDIMHVVLIAFQFVYVALEEEVVITESVVTVTVIHIFSIRIFM